ncbi:hypothetical protein F8388_021569 [Cannabis sativa]|uniref:Uncharacterized protein n=1 Tax=Cannabis sativa TaxID=3483 RepID=A0A7J6FEA6_CANSA|nr:hypothetical protein F8388_021569 [Cannabis sativa]
MMKMMMGDDNNKHNSNEVCELYEAAVDGCVATLKSLIQNDPLILSKICLSTQLTESPLHVSASLGHVEFTKELLRLKPKLASELDSLKRSPLHFAAAEGHAEIAVALLREDKGVCLVKDQDGKIPLHHAAVRGHVHLIKLLISSSGLGHIEESLFTPLPSGETILHLCVKHNHLDALKKVVHLAGCSENTDFLNAKDHESGLMLS